MTARLTLLALLAAAACREGAPRRPAGDPQRIVSQTVLADEVLWDLGTDVRARVVAVSKYADEPRYSRVAGRWPADIARLAENTELLVGLAPELAIVASFSSPEVRALLYRSGASVLQLESFAGFDGYRDNVRRIARAAGAGAAGEALIARFDQRLAALEARASSPTKLRALSWLAGIVAGGDTTFDDAAQAAGLVNVATAIPGHQRVTREQVLLRDPQLIVTGCGSDCAAAVRSVKDDVALSASSAVRAGRVVALPDRTLYSTGEGMLDLVAALLGAAES